MAFKATDFLITPSDIPRAIRGLFHMSWGGWIRLGLFIAAFFAIRHFGMDIDDAFFALFFAAIFLWDIDGRVPVSGAIGFLVLIVLIKVIGPYTQEVNETTWPEVIAVWVFYLLSTGVLKYVWDHMRGKEGADTLEAEPIERDMSPEGVIREEVSVPTVSLSTEVSPVQPAKEYGEIRRTAQGDFHVAKKGNRAVIKPL